MKQTEADIIAKASELEAMVINQNGLTIARLALETCDAIDINDPRNHAARALILAEDRINGSQRRMNLIQNIERKLLKMFRAAVQRHIDEHGYFKIDSHSITNRYTTLDGECITSAGFKIESLGYTRHSDPFELCGQFTGPLEGVMGDDVTNNRFSVLVEHEDGYDDQAYNDTDHVLQLEVGGLRCVKCEVQLNKIHDALNVVWLEHYLKNCDEIASED